MQNNINIVVTFTIASIDFVQMILFVKPYFVAAICMKHIGYKHIVIQVPVNPL